MTPLLFIPLFLVSTITVDAQSPCSTPSGGNGQCIEIRNCPTLNALIRDPSSYDLLRKSLCGYEGTSPKVCCPTEEKKSSQCTTPDGLSGTCVGFYSCAHLVTMAATNLAYIQRSICTGPEKYSVCCGPPPNASPSVVSPSVVSPNSGACALTATPPDPKTECCGLDGAGGNRIVGGNSTFIDQYPWLAIIEYVKNHKTKLLCGGVLISGRYVMTASHCVTGPVLGVGTPVNVRLGEYDTANSGPDCVEVEGGGTDCTPGAVVVPIEKTIPHPGYRSDSGLRRDDIALIRLAKLVEYTDFVRPICLPTTDFTQATASESVSLYVAGWGAVNEKQSSSNIKLHVDLPFITIGDCQTSYTVPPRRIQLWEGQMCAGGTFGKDSCKGDSGGPLMRENGRLMELVGIVSFGPNPCGIANVPGVYTKVFHYLPWITSQIEP